MIRDLWEYAQRHPFKAFMAVVVPLISAGGALHGLLKQFGVRIPFGLDGMFDARSGYSSYGDYGEGYGSVFGGSGGMETVSSLMKVAKAFM